MKRSLTLRLLVSASAVLIAFFGIAGIALHNAYRQAAEEATRERLQVHVYALLSAADLDTWGYLQIPAALPEPRFSNPGSGLYGLVFDNHGKLLWQSDSSIGIEISGSPQLKPGEEVFENQDDEHFVLYYPVVWESELGTEHEYLFVVGEDSEFLLRQVSAFAGSLWMWLGGVGLVLIVVQVVVLGWSLMPLRAIARDLESIDQGDKDRLDEDYPRELAGLAANMNALLDNERAHLERYRNTLANLAHSLKTPLAILRGCGNDPEIPATLKETLTDQVARMDEMVEYQLQRAAARGQKKLSSALQVLAVVKKITAALDKVYSGKSVNVRILGDDGFFPCEQGDLFEIAGNLLDNAYKWCKSTVEVSVRIVSASSEAEQGLHLIIDDDGPGIPADRLKQVLGRGIRADEATQGHGIGLAVVCELVQLSGGSLNAGSSGLGGNCWEVWLPPPS